MFYSTGTTRALGITHLLYTRKCDIIRYACTNSVVCLRFCASVYLCSFVFAR